MPESLRKALEIKKLFETEAIELYRVLEIIEQFLRSQ
jgi:hypothetical protein